MNSLRGTATALGAIRFGVCLVFLLQALDASFANLGKLPVTLMSPLGIMSRLPWNFYEALVSPTGMMLFKVALCGSLCLAAIGYLTRFTLTLALVLEVLYQGVLRSFSHFNHDEIAGLVILGILACSPAGDGFAVDRLGRARKDVMATIRHGFPVVLAQAVMAWVYFSSGLFKLVNGGLEYFSAENLPVLSIRHSLDNLQDTGFRVGFLLPSVAGVTPIFTAVVVLWELTFPIGLFYRKTRWWYLGFGILFHVGTLFLLNLMFWNMLAMYLVFVDWPRFIAWLSRDEGPLPGLKQLAKWTSVPEEFPGLRTTVPPGGRGELLWDGTCGFCARMVALLQRWLRRPVAARPFQEVSDLPTEVRMWTSRQMHWITPAGEILGGGRALVAAVKDGGREVIGAALGSAILRPFTWFGYRVVASNRDNLGPLAGAACEIGSTPDVGSS